MTYRDIVKPKPDYIPTSSSDKNLYNLVEYIPVTATEIQQKIKGLSDK